MTGPPTGPVNPLTGHRDAVAGQPRPARLSTDNLGEQVAAARDTADTYRVYRHEWVISKVTDCGPDPTGAVAELRRHVDEHLAGRVRPTDVRYTTAGKDRYATARLEIRMPTLKGEFKTADLATAYALAQGWDDAVIVARHSRADHDLCNYGVAKLPGGDRAR